MIFGQILSYPKCGTHWGTCSWKEQLERTGSWKVRSEFGKLEPKLESTIAVEKLSLTEAFELESYFRLNFKL